MLHTGLTQRKTESETLKEERKESHDAVKTSTAHPFCTSPRRRKRLTYKYDSAIATYADKQGKGFMRQPKWKFVNQTKRECISGKEKSFLTIVSSAQLSMFTRVRATQT